MERLTLLAKSISIAFRVGQLTARLSVQRDTGSDS